MSSSTPRPAATLVLLRDGAEGLEVLLTVRPRRLRFMGGAVVFPGGAVAPADLDARWRRGSARTGADAAARLGEPDEARALAFYVCALREAFEEVGLPPGRGGAAELERDAAHEPATFRDRCLQSGIVLATDELVAAGRWVTPMDSPVRFDTRFFLAPAPAGWDPAPDAAEVDACCWSTPRAALEELAAGRAVMAPPTIEMLQRLAPVPSARAALDGVVGGSLGGATPVLAARLSPLVQVVMAPNPGTMTGPGTNTYVVGAGPTWVVDPAVSDPAYIDAVAQAAGDVAAVLVTHRHADHCGGVAALVERTEAPVRAWGTAPAGGAAVQPLEEGDVLAVSGATLRALHTPGHARDHLCFLLPEERSLFAGDNAMGEGTPVIDPPEGDMRTYLATLRRLAQLELARIYPGHFRALDRPADVWAGLLEHRAERARRILAALAGAGASLEEIVARAYGDTASELHPVAARSALAHLEMLEDDGAIRRCGRVWKVRSG